MTRGKRRRGRSKESRPDRRRAADNLAGQRDEQHTKLDGQWRKELTEAMDGIRHGGAPLEWADRRGGVEDLGHASPSCVRRRGRRILFLGRKKKNKRIGIHLPGAVVGNFQAAFGFHRSKSRGQPAVKNTLRKSAGF